MEPQGAIADRMRGLIPITWDALKHDPRVGDSALQQAIDTAKAHMTGIVVDPDDEIYYPYIVIDYLAKVALVNVCNTAIDYWMNQANDVSSSGTNEHLSYIDRASMMQKLQAAYLNETLKMYPEIANLIGYWIDNGRAVPLLSSATINPFHLTPSPEEFPRPYRQTMYS